MESEAIIFGHVLYTYDNPQSKEYEDKSIARIAVLEILQGEMCEDTILVPFNPAFACPANPNYVDNTFVIAFLDTSDDSYTTHALYFGAKTLTKDEVEIYKARIYELQEILNHTSQRWQFTELVEWLVKCAENPATRWEGTFDLSPKSSLMSYYSGEAPKDFRNLLTLDQKERLKRALFTSVAMRQSEFTLVDLVYEGNEDEIEVFMISRLRAFQEGEYLMADEWMKRLQHRSASQEMTKLMKAYEEMQSGYSEFKDWKVIVDRFVQLVE
jgi:hypothetical protein